jgi:DNA topoisomerase-1
VLNAYLDGGLRENLATRAAEMAKSLHKLRPEEAAVLALLQRRLAAQPKSPKPPKERTIKQAMAASLKMATRRSKASKSGKSAAA